MAYLYSYDRRCRHAQHSHTSGDAASWARVSETRVLKRLYQGKERKKEPTPTVRQMGIVFSLVLVLVDL